MKSKKILSILLILSIVFIISSCNNSTTSSDSENSSLSTSTSTETDKSDISQNTEPTSEENSESASPDDGKYADEGELKLRIFKMGKSDAYLFRTNNKTILIDCGDFDDAQEIIDYFTEKNLKKIDYLIFTHLDKKSIGGAASIISTLEIGSIYEPDYRKTSTEYLDYSNAISNKSINPIKVNSSIALEFDGIKIDISPCEKSYYSDDDNYSSMISVTHKNNSFLFVGDAKSDRIKEIISKDNIKHDFILMPDNGALNPQTQSLIDAVSPSYAVITCSVKNPASTDVLELLSKKGINTYLTVNGSIRITSDGEKLTIEQ